ncbi:hypothetical protein MHYP_G00156980 [Metynnis hypsauchen]
MLGAHMLVDDFLFSTGLVFAAGQMAQSSVGGMWQQEYGQALSVSTVLSERPSGTLSGRDIRRKTEPYTESFPPETAKRTQGVLCFEQRGEGPKEKTEALNTGVWCKPHLRV